MWRKTTILMMLAVMVLPFLGPRPAKALTVSPLVFEYDAKPGDELAGAIKLYNETSGRETYYPTVQDFVASDQETGTPSFLAEGVMTSTSIAKWVAFDKASVTLESGETEYIGFKIRVPQIAAPGGYYGGLLMSTAPPQLKEGVSVASKVGPLVLVAVAGAVSEEGSILDFAASPSTVSSLPVNFGLRFQNTGSVHLSPVGEIRITNMLGGGSATIALNESGGNVLPESVRRFEASWQKDEVPEDSAEIVKEWKNFGFGLYTATAIVNYGIDDTVASATTSFWVIPWQLIILSVVALVILAMLGKSYNRAVVKNAMRRK